jgi:hypothetical protein
MINYLIGILVGILVSRLSEGIDFLLPFSIKKQCKVVYTTYGKISAIKQYRSLTKAGLKEAKEKIEDWFEKDRIIN